MKGLHQIIVTIDKVSNNFALICRKYITVLDCVFTLVQVRLSDVKKIS